VVGLVENYRHLPLKFANPFQMTVLEENFRAATPFFGPGLAVGENMWTITSFSHEFAANWHWVCFYSSSVAVALLVFWHF
jgi:hypothetical protein